MPVRRVNRRQVPDAIAAQQEFTLSTGHLNGRHMTPNRIAGQSLGRLAHRDLHQYLSYARAGEIRYLVTSYDTPIAWVTLDDEIYIVAQRFSPTTSRHQNLVRQGFGVTYDVTGTTVLNPNGGHTSRDEFPDEEDM
jgi:hypothetical protein